MIVALKLTKLGAPIVKFWTDCESIIKILQNSLLLRKQAHNDNLTLISQLLTEVNEQGVKSDIHWVKSHQDNYKDQEDWTKEETWNIIADSAANGDYNKILSIIGDECKENVLTFSISTEDILDIIGKDSGVHVTKNGIPHIGKLRDEFDKQNAIEYQRIRDTKKEIGDDHSWFTSSLEFAALVWNYEKLSKGEQHNINRIVYNKLWQQWNIFRYEQMKLHPNPEVTNKCVFCGEVDSMEHLLLTCRDQHSESIWREGYSVIQRVLSEIEPTETNAQVIMAVQELMDLPDSHHIWLGTWQPEQITYFKKRMDEHLEINSLSTLQLASIKETLLKTCSTLATVAQRLIGHRTFKSREARLDKKFPLRKSQSPREIADLYILAKRKTTKKKKVSKKKRNIRVSTKKDSKLQKVLAQVKITQETNDRLNKVYEGPAPNAATPSSTVMWDPENIGQYGYCMHQQWLRHERFAFPEVFVKTSTDIIAEFNTISAEEQEQRDSNIKRRLEISTKRFTKRAPTLRLELEKRRAAAELIRTQLVNSIPSQDCHLHNTNSIYIDRSSLSPHNASHSLWDVG